MMELAVGVYGRLARQAAFLLAMLIAAPIASAADGQDDFRILYFEPFSPEPVTSPSTTQQKAADDPLLAGIRFDAYGRRFELALERNTDVSLQPSATAVAYRGTVVQQPGSWARLTRVGAVLHGMIWDGSELYVVEPAALAREFMVAPLDPAQGGNVIYRLSDTLVDLGPNFCSALDTVPQDGTADGLTTFKALTSDLKSQLVLQQAPGATLALRISALGDALFLQRYASEAEARDAILVRLNNVDGIYSAQLGIEIQTTGVSVYGSGADPFTSTTVAGTLLDELGALRSNSSTLRGDGLTHLFTGRNLDGTTVGIAYINALCRRTYGVGLTESRGRGAAIESLIAAHEIGHNFGAKHDGDPSGECASTTADQFIMAPQSTTGNDTFSRCSIDTMSRSLAVAACISALPPPDAGVAFGASPGDLTLGQTFTWSVIVTNSGGQRADAATVEITLPVALALDDASVAGSSCVSGAGTIQCALGPLDAGDSRTVSLTLRTLASGVFTASAQAAATNETNTTNNTAMASLAVDATAPSTSTNPASTPVSGGSGGGGTMGFSTLLGLALLSRARWRRQTVP